MHSESTSFDELPFPLLGEITYEKDSTALIAKSLSRVLAELLDDDVRPDTAGDADVRKKAALHSCFHSHFMTMGNSLREIGLCNHARFDEMLDAFCPSIPDQVLVSNFRAYTWADVRTARQWIGSGELASCEEEYRDIIDNVSAAGEKMIALANIASHGMTRRHLSFTGLRKADEKFPGIVADTFSILGITADMEAYLAGDVPLDDIVA